MSQLPAFLLFWSALLLACSARSSSAAPSGSSSATPTAAPSAHTGRDVSVDDALAGSGHVVVAKFVSLGSPDIGAPGQQYWRDAEVEIVDSLSGTLTGRVRLSYTVQVVPASIAEAAPVVGERLILFVRRDQAGTRAIKILSADDANVSATKAAIARRRK